MRKPIQFYLGIAGLFMGCLAAVGCAGNSGVPILEGTVSCPYEVVGNLQVMKENVKVKSAVSSLNKKLREEVRKYEGVDAITQVAYWPELETLTQKRETIYARGKMIRYLPFPESTQQE